MQKDPRRGVTEELPLDDPAVTEFLTAQADAEQIIQQLTVSDLEMARVTEDLIDVLISKGTILLTDLPKAAQDKLAARRGMRERMDSLAFMMPEEEENIF